MDLFAYIDDTARRAALAEAVERSPDYLWQIATGRRRASTELALAIEQATEALGPAKVRKESMRPDVWPEAA